jgi:hypothetical protein
MAEKDVAPKEGKSNFERTTERIVERTGGDRVHPREDISRDNQGKIVGAREHHEKGLKDANKK